MPAATRPRTPPPVLRQRHNAPNIWPRYGASRVRVVLLQPPEPSTSKTPGSHSSALSFRVARVASVTTETVLEGNRCALASKMSASTWSCGGSCACAPFRSKASTITRLSIFAYISRSTVIPSTQQALRWWCSRARRQKAMRSESGSAPSASSATRRNYAHQRGARLLVSAHEPCVATRLHEDDSNRIREIPRSMIAAHAQPHSPEEQATLTANLRRTRAGGTVLAH